MSAEGKSHFTELVAARLSGASVNRAAQAYVQHQPARFNQLARPAAEAVAQNELSLPISGQVSQNSSSKSDDLIASTQPNIEPKRETDSEAEILVLASRYVAAFFKQWPEGSFDREKEISKIVQFYGRNVERRETLRGLIIPIEQAMS